MLKEITKDLIQSVHIYEFVKYDSFTTYPFLQHRSWRKHRGNGLFLLLTQDRKRKRRRSRTLSSP
ncbi:hypothetical protein Fmac_031545 [Flemingia macrophylla]|uniref:Uncharacterized protein n=1 Tax=Flemingia macrophylla TaxID=520843 RepID=A0ABD1L2D0_9FABA